MSNTTIQNITQPTEYTLLDNNHKYLPRDFTFIPTVSSKSGNNTTETVKNALDNTYYYTCTPQDFVCKIEVNEGLENVVYKTENESAYVYKISSGENVVYKYCENIVGVDINVLYNNGVSNIDISNVTVIKGEDVLKPIVDSLGCTEPDATKKITVPKDYDSLKINSSDVYFEQKNGKNDPSWVTINKNDDKNIVLFSNNITPTKNIIEFSDNNFTITLNKNTYSFNSMIDINLMNAYDNLTLKEPQLNSVAINLTLALRKAVTDLEQATIDLKQTSTNSEQAATNLKQAATNLEQAATDLGKEATNLEQTSTNLEQATIDLEQTSTNLKQAATDLGKAATNLGKAATDLGKAATNLGKAATNLEQAATNLGKAATDSEQAAQYFQNAALGILNTSLSLKQYKLFDEVEENNNTTYVWKNKNEDITDTDNHLLTTITTNFKECQEGVKGDEFNQYFDRLKAIYAIYNNDDNIGLMDKLRKCVVVNNTPVLKGILEKCFTINNPFENIKMFALDINNEMIISQTSSDSNNIYDLVYLENYNPNKDRILPKGDDFLTTTNSAKP